MAGFPENVGGRNCRAVERFSLRFADLSQVGDQAAQGVEFVVVEELGNPRFVRATDAELRFVDVYVHVGLDGDQRLAQAQVGQGFAESGLLLRREFIEMGFDSLKRAVFRNQFAGAHLADAGDAFHVVGRIAPDGEDVDDLAGILNAVLVADGFLRQDLVVRAGLAGLVLEDVVVHDLAEVLVGRDHIDVEPLSGELSRDRADYVVRLEAGLHQHGDVKGVHDFRKGFERGLHQFGCGGAGCLVFRVHFVPEGTARGIEHHGQVRRLFPGDQFQQVFRKPEEDGGVFPLRVHHGPAQEGIVHPENQGMSVDQVKRIHNLQI